MYKINQKVDIRIQDNRADFDRACESANYQAVMLFGIDDCGHSSKVEGWERSNCSIKIEFKKYTQYGNMVGWSHVYLFEAWVEQHIEEDE
jgi:hypothetical protein